MLEGQYLGAPPVNIGRARARVVLASMLRGGSSYGQAAGGAAPLALPSALQPSLSRQRPASPHADAQIAALFPLDPGLAKLNLRQRFGVGG